MKKIIIMALVLSFFSYVLSVVDVKGITEERQQYNEQVVDEQVFPEGKVVDVQIEIDPGKFQSMLDNPLAEEYTMANIIYNGQRLESVGIRTKGNSSLTSVARMENSDRYSFKIDFSQYLQEQTLFGISKLNLNNNFSDPTYMREYLSYKIFDQMGVPAARTCYVNITINGEPWGLYLAVEQIDQAFLARNFENAQGDLYKPDGVGSDLVWRGESMEQYSGVVLKTNEGKSDHSAFLAMLDELNNGIDYEQYINVDGFLRYLAVSTVLSNLDSYQGQMKHNYYLYEDAGVFHIFPWDLNMSFGGFGMGRNSGQQTELKIDQPTMGALEDRPLIANILNVPEYLAQYHQYVAEVIETCLNIEQFQETVASVAEMIAPYVEADPTKFYTYEQFQQSLYENVQQVTGLIPFVEARVTNVRKQLSGEIPAVNTNGSESSGGLNSSFDGGERMAGAMWDRGTKPDQGAMPNRGEFPVEGEMPKLDGEGAVGRRPGGMNDQGGMPGGGAMPDQAEQGENGRRPGGMMQPGEMGGGPWQQNGTQSESQYYMSSSEIAVTLTLLLCLIIAIGVVYFVKRK